MANILTSRMQLRALALDDAPDLFEVRGDPEAMAYWDWPHDSSPEATRAVVGAMIQEVSNGDAKYWALRLQADDSFVGLCDLSELRLNESADLGFMLARRHWGQGLAYEAVEAILDVARQLNLKLLRARIHASNERSARLLTRAGFVATELTRQMEVRPGVFRDCWGFARSL